MKSENECNKAVILARGLGTRMRRLESGAELNSAQANMADTGMKAMIPIGRPFLDYVLSYLADAGLTDVCLVIGPEHGYVREYYDRLAPVRVRIQYAIQAEPLGTANAVLAARDFAAGQDFVVLNSDNYYPSSTLWSLRSLGFPGAVMYEEAGLVRKGNMPAERVRSFAYATTDSDGYLAGIVEKPAGSPSRNAAGFALISMNSWRFDRRIFRFCSDVQKSVRGEYELPAAVCDAVRDGIRFKILCSQEAVLDLSQRSDIAAVAERLKNVKVSL